MMWYHTTLLLFCVELVVAIAIQGPGGEGNNAFIPDKQSFIDALVLNMTVEDLGLPI